MTEAHAIVVGLGALGSRAELAGAVGSLQALEALRLLGRGRDESLSRAVPAAPQSV